MRSAPRHDCPICGHRVALRLNGALYRHRDYSRNPWRAVGDICPGSGRTLDKASRRALAEASAKEFDVP